jgi:cobalt-zinc-cadmium efflux system outer membrane protein
MLLGLFSPASAHAQPATALSIPLSLQDAILMAREREPGLRAERSQVDVALGNLSQAGLKPNPTVSLGWQQQPGGVDNQTALTFEWPLELFRAAGRVAVAEREADVERLRITDRERQLAAEVRAAYGALAAAQRELNVLAQLTDTATRQLDVIRSRVDAGTAPALDRDLMVVERRRLDADRLLLDARANSARLALQRLLGLSPTDRVTLQDSLESLVDVPSAPSSSADVRSERRPDVQVAEAGVRVADASLARAQRDGRFDVSLFGTYTRMRTMFPQLGVASNGALEPVGDTFHYLAVGATLTLPWRNDNRGEIAAAEARRHRAEAQLAAAALQARTEVAAATTQDEQSRAAVALYAREVLPLARQNVDVVKQTYELGRGTVADVLTEQRRYLDIERAYTDALKQAYDARTSLLSAQGVQP